MRLETVATEQCRESVKAVLSSRLFQDAPVLQKLLSYLAGKSFSANGADLKEYTIGVELFGKPEGYSPQSDPSVRVQAGRLRRKLEEYYRGEGAGSQEIIHLPKGSFQIVFEERPVLELPDAEPKQLPLSLGFPWKRVAIAAAALALAISAVTFWQSLQLRAVRKELAERLLEPALSEFWGPLISSPRPLLIVVGVPLFVQMNGGSFRHPKVNVPADLATVPEAREMMRREGITSPHFFGIYTGVGEAAAVFSLGRVFAAANKLASISRSSELGWDEAVTHDLILLGSSKSQPQLREVGVLVNYRLVPGGIEVLHPEPGEPSFYGPNTPAHQPPTEDYSIVARLPGISGSGNGYVMVIGADSTNGTWGGVDSITDPHRAAVLMSHLRGANGELPEYFEVIVKEQFKGGRPVAMTSSTTEFLRFHPRMSRLSHPVDRLRWRCCSLIR